MKRIYSVGDIIPAWSWPGYKLVGHWFCVEAEEDGKWIWVDA